MESKCPDSRIEFINSGFCLLLRPIVPSMHCNFHVLGIFSFRSTIPSSLPLV